MAFSSVERERRDKAMHRIMEAHGLKALILFGDTNVGSDILGDFRYYVDNRIIAGRQAAMLFPEVEPVLFVGSPIQQQAAARRSSIRDCRLSDDMPADMATLLKQRNVSTGKTIRDIVAAIDAYVKSSGYLPKPPYGHICGIDLIDGRVSPQNGQALEEGLAVILHPTIFTPDGKNSFFWGETYLVTDDGYERLNHVSDELITL